MFVCILNAHVLHTPRFSTGVPEESHDSENSIMCRKAYTYKLMDIGTKFKAGEKDSSIVRRKATQDWNESKLTLARFGQPFQTPLFCGNQEVEQTERESNH